VIVKLLGQINDALDITSIVVSHDVHDVAAVADFSYVIADGNVAAAGTPAELKETDSELVKQFMHGLADGPVGFHYDAPDYEEQLLGKSAK
jgi:phospholipid/cholesterol/gamma-HCH transport system ATP-binding protein